MESQPKPRPKPKLRPDALTSLKASPSPHMVESPQVTPDRKRLPPPIFWLVGLVLLAVASLLVLMDEPMAPYLSRGDPAPAFQLPSLQGESVVEMGELQGRVVLLNFWATWCKPCEEEMPAMEALHAELPDDGFELVAISVDESRADVEAFRERLGLTFPVLLDPGQDVARLYHTTGFPESFLVDGEGKIVERYVGPREWDHPDYIRRIRRLIESDSVDAPSGLGGYGWGVIGAAALAVLVFWRSRKRAL